MCKEMWTVRAYGSYRSKSLSEDRVLGYNALQRIMPLCFNLSIMGCVEQVITTQYLHYHNLSTHIIRYLIQITRSMYTNRIIHSHLSSTQPLNYIGGATFV